MNQCYLKGIEYYGSCLDCSANDQGKVCYSTREEFIAHVKHFEEMFCVTDDSIRPLGRRRTQLERFYKRYPNWDEFKRELVKGGKR